MRIRLFLARVMSTAEFPTMESKKIVPYSGIIRFSRRLSWPDDCEMTGEVTLAISEVTVEKRGRSVTIDESSSASRASKYSVETGLSDRLRPWIDIFLSLVLFNLSFPPSSTSCVHAGGSTLVQRMLHRSEMSLYIELLSHNCTTWMFCSLFATFLTFTLKSVLRWSQQRFLHIWSIAARFADLSRLCHTQLRTRFIVFHTIFRY